MSAESDEIKKCIQQLAGVFGVDKAKLIIATVTDNTKAETDFVVSVTPINDNSSTPINNVKINVETNDGFLIVPAMNSTILVLSSDVNDYYCIMYSDIQKVVCIIDNNNSYNFSSSGFIWNDGLLGGMAKTAVLQNKYNVLETQHNDIKSIVTAILAAGIGSPGTPVTNATLAAYFTSFNVVPVLPTTQFEIEDPKIKH